MTLTLTLTLTKTLTLTLTPKKAFLLPFFYRIFKNRDFRTLKMAAERRDQRDAKARDICVRDSALCFHAMLLVLRVLGRF